MYRRKERIEKKEEEKDKNNDKAGKERVLKRCR